MKPGNRPEQYIGRYRSLAVGFSRDERIRCAGASGGVVTDLLVSALERGAVEAACVVGMNGEKPWLPEVTIAGTKEEIISASGSKYVLIDVRDMLERLDREERPVAVVGLPCHVRALRRLMGQGRYGNVRALIGLFCGYNMPYEATEFLIGKLGVRREEIASLEYRGGDYPGGFLLRTTRGEEKFLPKYYYDFINLIFVPRGCLHCGDYTNELADISVGDAWGHDNHSVIMVRTAEGSALVKDSTIAVKEIGVEELFRMHGHNIRHKKVGDPLTQRAAAVLLRAFGRHLPFPLLAFLARSRRRLLVR